MTMLAGTIVHTCDVRVQRVQRVQRVVVSPLRGDDYIYHLRKH